MFALCQKLTLERFQLQLVGGFLIDFSAFSQNGAIYGNLNHY